MTGSTATRMIGATAVAVVVTGLLVAAVGYGQAAQDCDEVEGVLRGTFTGPLSTAGTIDSNDKILADATTLFAGDDLEPSAGLDPTLVPPSTASYTGVITITTPGGTLTLRDVGVFDTDIGGGDGEFASRARVIGGEGVFDQASGLIFFHGDTNPDLTFHAPFTGRICVVETA